MHKVSVPLYMMLCFVYRQLILESNGEQGVYDLKSVQVGITSVSFVSSILRIYANYDLKNDLDQFIVTHVFICN